MVFEIYVVIAHCLFVLGNIILLLVLRRRVGWVIHSPNHGMKRGYLVRAGKPWADHVVVQVINRDSYRIVTRKQEFKIDANSVLYSLMPMISILMFFWHILILRKWSK